MGALAVDQLSISSLSAVCACGRCTSLCCYYAIATKLRRGSVATSMFCRALVLLLVLLFPTDGFFSPILRASKGERTCRFMSSSSSGSGSSSSSSSSSSSTKDEKIGIIIIDHGSRMATANDMLLEVRCDL